MSSPLSNTPIRITDPRTGVEIVQLVGDAASSAPLSYDWPAFSPDDRRVIVRCDFSPESRRPSGFYRANTDGGDLTFVAEGGIHPRLTPDGRWLYHLREGDPLIYRTEVESGRCEEVGSLERVLPKGYVYVQMRLSPTSNHLFVMLREPDITPIRVDLSAGRAVRLEQIDGMLWACVADEPRIVVARMKGAEKGRAYGYSEYRKLERTPGDRSLWSLDLDGDDERFICVDLYSHATMLGRTANVQGCGKWGTNAIMIAEEGKETRKLCEGPYFWHSGAAFDAEWLVADTNWPDYGLQLVHVPTGNFRTLCFSGSSLKTGLVHPHPGLSNDGRIATFRSDRTGECQAYLVHIPEEFRESIVAGVGDEPEGGWIVRG